MTKRIIWTAASVLGAAAISSSLTVLAVSRQYADRSSSLSFAGEYEQYNSAATGKEMPDGSDSYHAVDIPDDVRVEEITYGNAADMIQTGDDFILYFGFPDCYYCRYEISALTRALADNNQTLYSIRLPLSYWSTARSTYAFPEGVPTVQENLDKVEEVYTNADYDSLLTVIADSMDDGNSLPNETIRLDDGTYADIPDKYRLYAPTIARFEDGNCSLFNPEDIDFSQSADETSDEKLYEQFREFIAGEPQANE